MNDALLKQHIQSDPALSGLTDAQIAAAINAATYPVLGYIGPKRRIGWATKWNVWGALEASSEAVAKGTLAILRIDDDLDVADTETQTFLSALVAKGLITQEARDDLETRATEVKPLWSKFGTREIDHADVARAMA